MLKFKYVGSSLIVLTMLAFIPAATFAVCAQPTAQPVPAPMLYPGEVVACPGCCPGPCMCVPNVGNWGHFQRQWRQWPGSETRVDIHFPQRAGIEKIKAPQGTLPEKLPKEEYAEPQAEPGPGFQIQQGLPTGPVETPAPFDLGPNFGGGGLPGLDVTPQGPAPEQPSLEGLPVEGEPAPTPDNSSSRTVPPAPMSYHDSSIAPVAPSRPVNGVYPAPPVPTSESSVALTNPVVPATMTEDAAAPPPAPLPGEEKPLEASVASLPSEEAWMPPIDAPVQSSETESIAAAPLPTVAGKDEPKVELVTDAPAPLAPLPESESPSLAKAPAASQDQADQKSQAAAWKSRRAQAPLPSERTVNYEEPVGASEIGLEGYCPVSLLRSERWVEGSSKWAVEYKGQIYRTAGPVEQRQFRADPDRYAPVLSGCDPVLAFEGEGHVSGRTDACVIYQGRLLMFYSQESLARFRQDPDSIMAKLPPVEKP